MIVVLYIGDLVIYVKLIFVATLPGGKGGTARASRATAAAVTWGLGPQGLCRLQRAWRGGVRRGS